MTKKTKPIRFAALIRVSTEKQAAKGESLKTQAKQITQAVESLGGKLVAKYAGQEHGTAGYERKQLDKMLADAQKERRPFDAVMVAAAELMEPAVQFVNLPRRMLKTEDEIEVWVQEIREQLKSALSEGPIVVQ